MRLPYHPVSDEPTATRPTRHGPVYHLVAPALLVVTYLSLWAGAGYVLRTTSDLDLFFLPAVHVALGGHPLGMYMVRDGPYPNANGPLSLVPLTVLEALAIRLGWQHDLSRDHALILSAMSVFPLLVSRAVVREVERIRGTALRGLWRLAIYAIPSCGIVLWISVLLYGHIEQPIMIWLVFLALHTTFGHRYWLAGLLLGFAVLTRSIAVIYLIALLGVPLAERRWFAAARMAVGAAAVVALGLLPFYVADPGDVTYSLFASHSTLPMRGGSVWEFTLGTPLAFLGQHLDSLFVIMAAGIATVWFLARRGPRLTRRDGVALLLMVSVCGPLLLNTIWPYYFLDAYLFGAVWALSGLHVPLPTWRQWTTLLVPLFFTVCAVAPLYDVWYGSPVTRRWQSAILALLLCGYLAIFAALYRRARQNRPAATSSAREYLSGASTETPVSV